MLIAMLGKFKVFFFVFLFPLIVISIGICSAEGVSRQKIFFCSDVLFVELTLVCSMK